MIYLIKTTEVKLVLALIACILFPIITPVTPTATCRLLVETLASLRGGDTIHSFPTTFCSSTYVYYFHVIYICLCVVVLHLIGQGPSPSSIVNLAKTEVQKDRKKRKFIGHSCVVTGANAGIGYYTVKYLAATGFRVVMMCRDKKRAEEAKLKLLKDDPDADLRIVLGDVSDLKSLQKVAKNIIEEAQQQKQKFCLLVNNAGLFCPTKVLDEKTGMDKALVTNYLGPYQLTEYLVPHLMKKENISTLYGAPRIVNVSSIAHYWMQIPSSSASSSSASSSSTCVNILNMNKEINCYGISKLCNILHAKNLAKRFGAGTGAGSREIPTSLLLTSSLHPGSVASEIWRWIPSFVKPLIDLVMNILFKTSEQGAMTTLFCCLAQDDTSNNSGCCYNSGDFLSDCQVLPPLPLARKLSEADAVEEWTKETLKRLV